MAFMSPGLHLMDKKTQKHQLVPEPAVRLYAGNSLTPCDFAHDNKGVHSYCGMICVESQGNNSNSLGYF